MIFSIVMYLTMNISIITKNDIYFYFCVCLTIPVTIPLKILPERSQRDQICLDSEQFVGSYLEKLQFPLWSCNKLFNSVYKASAASTSYIPTKIFIYTIMFYLNVLKVPKVKPYSRHFKEVEKYPNTILHTLSVQ